MPKLNLEQIIKKQLEILQGISIEDLTHRSLLSFAQLLVKEYKRSTSFLKDPSLFVESSHYDNWRSLKNLIDQQIQEVILEVQKRMIPTISEDGEEEISGGLLVRYLGILSDLKACLQEEKLNEVITASATLTLPDKNVQAVQKIIHQYEL